MLFGSLVEEAPRKHSELAAGARDAPLGAAQAKSRGGFRVGFRVGLRLRV